MDIGIDDQISEKEWKLQIIDPNTFGNSTYEKKHHLKSVKKKIIQ